MIYLWLLIYNFFYPIIFLIALIFSIFNVKIRESLIGKFNVVSVLRKNSVLFNGKNKIYWFHVSSLGEFFQIASILKLMREVDKRIKLVVSFTSPSGFKYAHNDLFDVKFYLPFDFIWVINRVLNIIKPKKIIFSSYDIWFNFLFLAKLKNIETTLTSLAINNNSYKNKFIFKSYYKTLYKNLDFIHVVNDKDKINLERIFGSNNFRTEILISGNPRIDFIYDEFQKKNSGIKKRNILKREDVLIIASSHENDDDIIIPGLIKTLNKFPDWKVLYIPHEPTKKNINKIRLLFKKKGKKVEVIDDKILSFSEKKIYLISSVGILAKLYWIAKIAYVGGGFSTGIHNIIEPCLANVPILIGPRYNNSSEAKQLIMNGGAVLVKGSIDFSYNLEVLMEDKERLSKLSEIATNTILSKLGSTKKIIKDLKNA